MFLLSSWNFMPAEKHTTRLLLFPKIPTTCQNTAEISLTGSFCKRKWSHKKYKWNRAPLKSRCEKKCLRIFDIIFIFKLLTVIIYTFDAMIRDIMWDMTVTWACFHEPLLKSVVRYLHVDATDVAFNITRKQIRFKDGPNILRSLIQKVPKYENTLSN